MQIIRIVLARIRALFRRDVITDEIREEMQFHLDERASELRERGLASDEAARAAKKRFGNVALMADRGYDVRGAGWLETVWQDVRYAVRILRRQRGFAAVTVLTLALAMGASTALFSVIDAALLRPVPYPNAERIVEMTIQVRQPDGTMAWAMAPSAEDIALWRAPQSVFAHIGQGRISTERLIVDLGQPERVDVSRISSGYLEVFGVVPVLGRPVLPEDTREDAPRVVWLSHDYWRRAFASGPSVLNTAILIDGEPATVVGVLPASFYIDSENWLPMPDAPQDAYTMRGSGTPTYGRLQPNVSAHQAAEQLTALSPPEPARSGAADIRVQLVSLFETTVEGYRPAVRLLAASVLLVLLIACANVAGLLLAQGLAREGELAVRAALGAGRGRLVRQLLTESLIVASVGGIAGLFIAWLALDGLVSVLPLRLADNSQPALNLTVLAFSAGLSLVVTVLSGLLPAIRLSHVRLGGSLARVGRQHRTFLPIRSGWVLVASEVAMAIVLLAGSGLMIRSLDRAMAVDVGFTPASFVTMEVFPVDSTSPAQDLYFDALLGALRATPGVAAAGAIDLAPLSGSAMYTDSLVDGREVFSAVKTVTPGYFEAIGLAPIAGRLPGTTEAGATAVLSESAARALFRDGTAIGRTFRTRSAGVRTVVGVVPDIRSRRALIIESDRPDVYLVRANAADGQSWHWTPVVVVRPSAGDTGDSGLFDVLGRTALAVGPPVIVERIRSGSDWFGDNLKETRNRTLLLGLVGGLGLALTLVGIVSTTAQAVSRRTHEVGVRMAFGARPGDVVRHMLRDTFRPVLAGTAVGLLGAWYATRFIESFLYDTPPREPVTFVVVAVIMIVVAVLAAWIPARRAANVDPVVALRAE
jgi:putative ABC transport system permease protein